MRSFTCYPVFFLLLLSNVACARVFPVQVEGNGVSDDVVSNIVAHLGEVEMDSATQLSRFRPGLNRSVRIALEALGYYHGRWSLSIKRGRPSLRDSSHLTGEEALFVHVEPGPPVIVDEMNIDIEGGAKGNPALMQVIAGARIKKGIRLRQWHYDELKADLFRACLAAGYLDAKYERSKLEIDRKRNLSIVSLTISSGERYRFGNISFQSSDLEPELMDRLARFYHGEYFSQERFQTIRQNLSRSGYFERIDIRQVKRVDKASQQHVVDVVVDLKNRESHYFDIGAGYSTDSGPKGSLGWRWPLVNSSGHALNGTLELSRPEQEVSFNYRIPLHSPLVESLNWNLDWQSKTIDSTRSMVTSLGFFYRYLRENNWQHSYGLELDGESYKEGGKKSEHVFYLVPVATWSRSEIKEGIDPDSGYSVRFSIEGSHPSLGSDTAYLKSTFAAHWLTPLFSHNWLLLTRMEVGAIATGHFAEVPLSRRYFTGGDASVRGFQYETIAPRNKAGDLVGGQYLSVASAELNYRIAQQWRLGVFYDIGRAFSDFDDPFFSSVGPGVRWLSPFGQIRFDLAFPLKGDEAGNPRLHVSFGRVL